MFNTTIVHPTQFQQVTEHHHEHRAPTDESIELLKEMEQEAQKKLLSRSVLKDNPFNAEWYLFDSDGFQWSVHVKCKFGAIEEHIILNIDKMDVENPHSAEVHEIIMKRLAERVTELFILAMPPGIIYHMKGGN